MPNPYLPSTAAPSKPQELAQASSASDAFFGGCRDGLLWSLAVMLPVSFLVVPTIPRRLPRDSGGNLVPYFESVGYVWMLKEIIGFVTPIAMIWTLSAGTAGLIRYIRTCAESKEEDSPQGSG